MNIYLHGIGQTGQAWDQVRELVGGESLAPDVFDFPEATDSPTYQNIYQGLVNYLAPFEEIDHLVGLSMGGILALNYALDHPDKVKELVISGGQYKIPNTLLRIQIAVFDVLTANIFKDFSISKQDVIIFLKSILGVDFSDRMPYYHGPAKIIVGRNDRLSRPAAKGLAQLLPEAKSYLLDGGHVLNLERPTEIAEIIEEEIR